MPQQSKIKVRVDKSHLFTLGEKMYRESIEFIRELVNNAYDADATEVYVSILRDSIEVRDNGSGMNQKGLEQFFTIGSEEKKVHSISPRMGRKRIGQFGIGKFSALSLADQFMVESVRGKYKYRVVFDKKSWQISDHWELPIQKEKTSPLDSEGTTVILKKLTKKIHLAEVEKYLKQSVPLRAKKFAVFLNNKRVSAKTITGKIIPIRDKTIYGDIEGEIVLALNPKDVDEPGLECRVKQVFIKRDLFDVDKKHHQGIGRITGYVNADFLPLIASRSDFILDSPQYKIFYQLMHAKLNTALAQLKRERDKKNIKKITRELQDVMKHIRDALEHHPEFIPQGKAITRLKKEGRQKFAAASADMDTTTQSRGSRTSTTEKTQTQEQIKKKEKTLEKKIEAKPLVMKRIRLKKFGVSCAIVSLGENGPEVTSQGNIIYINQDHPTYQKLFKKKEILRFHLYRLITQEIVLMKKLKITAREAFEWQGKLLKDSLNI